MTTQSILRMTRIILGLVTIAITAWIIIGNTVPSGSFVTEKRVGEVSPWIKNFWPPMYISSIKHSSDWLVQQRIVRSPVTVRVHTPPQKFSSVTVALDTDGISGACTIGVERQLRTQNFVAASCQSQMATLSLDEVDQRTHDFQFQFTFSDIDRDHPVTVHSVRFVFTR